MNSLDDAEEILKQLGRQYKSGQHVLICDALDEIKEARTEYESMRRVIDAVKGCKEEWLDLDDHVEDGKKCLCEKCILIRLYDEYEKEMKG